METITIHVTEKAALEASSYTNYNNCLIATAVKQQLGTTNVSAGGSYVTIDDVNYNFSNADAERLQCAYYDVDDPNAEMEINPLLRSQPKVVMSRFKPFDVIIEK